MPRAATFDFIVSAENNFYVAWQAMVFHYSCLQAMDQSPIIVVHGDEEALLPPFEAIRQLGGRVQRARNFRSERGWDYAPRNTPGTLSVVESEADYLVMCDPDMIFLRPLPLDDYQLSANQISLDKVSYLFVTDENRESLSAPAATADVDLSLLQDRRFSGGVPHIIPRTLQQSLSRDWLDCIECFEPSDALLDDNPEAQMLWLSSMWGLAFAMCRLDLGIVMTNWSIQNCPGTKRLDALENKDARIVHYCLGDEEFNKRDYMDQSGAASRVWNCAGTKDTINDAIIAQIRGAAELFGIPVGVT